MFSVCGCNKYKLMRFPQNGNLFPVIATNSVMSAKASQHGVVENSIRDKLSANLNPVHLNVINESYMHNVPKGSETHFKVVVVSEKFDNVSLLQRHQLVNELLKEELENGVHALSIVAKTPSQWNANEEVKSSPKCLGGFGK